MHVDRYLCIHSHFYQPPRENPWLETIELQDSAYPDHDWNERVTAECYAPNASARILDGQQRIVRIVNNYSHISFNFGPTLLSWMKGHASEVYESLLEADRESRARFSGHGSAIAQGYNHIILPLANSRDKWTQILWGVADFESRFGRKPESMWLPETAVDLESLDLMAKAGMKFAILAPHQAKASRCFEGGGQWLDCNGATIDPSRPYLCRLPSGRSISLFFYDGPVSQAVAFENLLNNGEKFANRLTGGFSDARVGPQLMHIATDGETYGHHHRYGEMALAYALDLITTQKLAKITNYGEFLELFPPSCEVTIHENSSWSCMHGVERWRSNCGCNSGRVGWRQEWRRPLREALDWLRDRAATLFEVEGALCFKSPWAARDAYISVLLNPEPENRERFIQNHFLPNLDDARTVAAWKLLEMQRHALLMYTSCGWFFDEISGLETVQVIQYAGRVVQLFEDVSNTAIEKEFEELLAKARSNITEYGDGAEIYRTGVKPAVVNLEKVGAHYAISSLFESYGDETDISSYSVKRLDYHARESGRFHMAMGKAQLVSKVTRESQILAFGAIHFGDHNVISAVRPFVNPSSYAELLSSLLDAFSRAETAQVVLLLNRAFGEKTYSLKSLFRDEQRRILNKILASTIEEAESVYLNLYQNHAALMRFIGGLNSPIPKELETATEYAINSLLRHAFGAEELEGPRIYSLLEERRDHGVRLDTTTLEYTLRRNLDRMSRRLAADPSDISAVEKLESALSVAKTLPFSVSLWSVQNRVYEVFQNSYKEFQRRAQEGDLWAEAWVQEFRFLAMLAEVRVD
jgi:alpha-amylase/alpha-mannosidase (GH57 family)